VFFAAFLFLQFDFVIFWQKNIGAKTAGKMLMEFTFAVNFINILHAPFALIFLHQNITKPNVTREKLLNLVSYKKRPRKMLMKLTLGRKFSFCIFQKIVLEYV